MTLKQRSQNTLSAALGRYHECEFTKGEGYYLYTTNNKKLLDFSSGLAVTNTGHCHPEVVKAIQNQAATLIHACIGNGHYEPPVKLAELIQKKIGPTPYSIFFSQSGSDANEAAIKLAKYVTNRQKLVAFTGGFHGRTLGALSLTTSKMSYRKGYDPLLQGIDFFPYPISYRCPWNQSTKEASTKAAINALETSPLFNQDVAAVIIEPILGEGGYYEAPALFLETLEKICKKHGILLILDEVQTGFGRTGKWFAYQHTTLQPDIITAAKGIASGMPLGACIAKKDIMEKWPPGAHGGTFGANPVCCAAGIATITVLDKHLQNVSSLGATALDILTAQLANHTLVGDIRVKGLMIAIEFVKNKLTKEPNPEIISTILSNCLNQQLIVIACGIHSNVIRLIPPLTIDKPTLLKGLSLFTEVIHDIN